MGGLVSEGCKGGKNIGEGTNHGSIILGGLSVDKDGVEVINVCNKDVLHGLEGALGNASGRLVYIVPMLRWARAAKQNMLECDSI